MDTRRAIVGLGLAASLLLSGPGGGSVGWAATPTPTRAPATSSAGTSAKPTAAPTETPKATATPAATATKPAQTPATATPDAKATSTPDVKATSTPDAKATVTGTPSTPAAKTPEASKPSGTPSATGTPGTPAPTGTPSGTPSPTPSGTPSATGTATTADALSVGLAADMDAATVSAAAGGKLRSRDGAVEVEVPAGAADEALSVRHQPASQGGRGRVKIARAFHLTAVAVGNRAVTTWKKPVAIKARYTTAELRRAGIDEGTVGIYYLNESKGAWERLPSAPDDDATAGIATGTVDHFSVFAVGGEIFETAGAGSGNSFADNFTDLNAWTQAAGTWTLGTNLVTATGTRGTRDDLVATNSASYGDFTFQAQVRDQSKNNNHFVGLIGRYQNANTYYYAALVNDNVRLYERNGGTDTQIGTAAFAYTQGTPYWLRLQMSGSTITVSTAPDSSGSPGSYTQRISVTDSTITSGQVGLINVNNNGGGAARNGVFAAPGVTITLPQDWDAVTQTTGRPGMIWDRVSAAHTGTGSLQIFSGNSGFVGHSAQTTNNTVVPGTPYQVSGWIKTTGVSTGGANGAKLIMIEQPSGTQTTIGTQTGTAGWTQYSLPGSFVLQSDTTSVQVRALLQGAGVANFDDVAFGPALTMTISTNAAPFGNGLTPDGAASSESDVGTGYTDTNGAYYVKARSAGSQTVSVTVRSSKSWTGTVSASENSGTSGMRIANGNLRWKLGDVTNLGEAQGATAFTTTNDATVFDTASFCASGSTKNAGVCTYNYDYTLRVGWTDDPGTFDSVVTYTATQ